MPSTTLASHLNQYEQALVLAGLPSNLPPEHLVHLYQEAKVASFLKDQSFEIEERKTKNALQLKELEGYKTKVQELYLKIKELEQTIAATKLHTHAAETKLNTYKDKVLLYGQHTKDCNYIDMVESGKITSKTKEIEVCDCGFTSTKQIITGIVPEEPKILVQEEDEL